jgi:hypothetical protein
MHDWPNRDGYPSAKNGQDLENTGLILKAKDLLQITENNMDAEDTKARRDAWLLCLCFSISIIANEA